MPFWLSVLLALLGAFYFSFFWEVIPLFLISDLLWGVRESRFLNVTLVSLITSILILVSMELLKRKLRFQKIKNK
jgi:hypothetical protein